MGSSKQPSQTTTTQKVEPPSWAVPYYQSLLSQSAQLANRPYQGYDGQQIAGFTPTQLAAQGMVANQALNNNPINSGINYATGLLGGQGQFNAQQNPYQGQTASVGNNKYLGATTNVGSNQYIGQSTPVGSNQYLGATTNVGTNKYAGENPYLDSVIQKSIGDITDNFNKSTVPSLFSQFNSAGAYGGTAMQDAASTAEQNLAQQLSDTSNQYRFQDYSNQQQLAENDINRRLQAQQTDLARNAGLAESGLDRSTNTRLADLARNAGLVESGLDRSVGAQQTDLARNAGLAESGLDRSLGAQQTDLARNAGLADSWLSRQQDAWSTGQGNQLAALGMLPGLNQAGYYGAQQLAGVGDAQQQLNQANLDQAYNNWLEQRDWRVNNLGLLGNGLNSISGAFQTGTSAAPNLNRGSPIAGALGGAATGASIGSIIPGLGTGLGAGIGGLLGLFS